MIVVEFEDALSNALDQLPARISARSREGLDATCEAIAARARQTTTYRDVTGLLRQSTQNAGVEGSGDELVGIVSFAARSKQGFLYGVVVNARGQFIEDAIAAQDGALLEGSLASAFRDCGFLVRNA